MAFLAACSKRTTVSSDGLHHVLASAGACDALQSAQTFLDSQRPTSYCLAELHEIQFIREAADAWIQLYPRAAL